ncbi:MAG TPA: choice-of-anchor Q domain-containing protein [Anaerolineae bacterium]|nr:choice-of-anchor Q domain-containing protein [Anaerolineae bacterium]
MTKRSLLTVIGTLIVCLLAYTQLWANSQQEFEGNFIYYVDRNSTASAPDGSSWQMAYPTVQTALGVAAMAGGPSEIWVADGLYYPDEGVGQVDNERQSTFMLQNHVSLYGGFSGLGGDEEVSRDQRQPDVHLTILSGDLDQNDVPAPSGIITNTQILTGSNSYHVVSSDNITSAIDFDGFVVTAGLANGDLLDNAHIGGGMYNKVACVININNVVFSGNYADSNGGGIYNITNCAPQINHVTLQYNTAGSFGGGVFNSNFTAPTLQNVTFLANQAAIGGGIYSNSDVPILNNTIFLGNRTTSHGGGMYNNGSHPQITNALFAGNYSDGDGAAIYNNSSSPTLNHVTIASNYAGGIFSDGAMFNNFSGSLPTIENSLFYNNQDRTGLNTPEASIKNGFSATPVISYTLIANSNGSGASWVSSLGSDGGNNLDVDPLFVESVAAVLAPTVAGNYRLAGNSPANDQAYLLHCPATDVVGNGRPSGAGCDLGAYEYQAFVFTVSLDVNNYEATFTWSETASGTYQVWRSDTAYTGFSLYQTPANATYIEVDDVDNVLQNHFYYLTDPNAGVTSQEVGIFTFGLTLGE